MLWNLFVASLKGHRWGILGLMVLGIGFALLFPTTYQAYGGEQFFRQFLQQAPKGVGALLKSSGGALQASGVEGYILIAFRHPLMLVAGSALAIALASGAVARQVESRAVLLLLARPIPRSSYLLAHWLEMALAVAGFVGALLAGIGLGLAIADTPQPLSFTTFGLGALAAYGLFMAVGGIALLLSSAASDGGVATGLGAAIALFLFLLDFVSGLWAPLGVLGPASPFHYYNPVSIVEQGLRPLDIGVLYGTALVATGAAFARFRMRDIA